MKLKFVDILKCQRGSSFVLRNVNTIDIVQVNC